MPTTLLSINGINFSDWATRGITMTLAPIGSGDLRRDVNGTLRDLTLAQFRKYKTSIKCSDQEAPTFDTIWKGSVIEVTCIPELGVGGDDTDGVLTMFMMVEDWEVSRDEYECECGWSLSALEI